MSAVSDQTACRPARAEGLSSLRTALLIAVLGSATLFLAHFGPPETGKPTLVLVPPWRDGGLSFAKSVDVPLLDMRWGGRLLVFAPTDDEMAWARMGSFVMPVRDVAGCFWIADNQRGEA